MISSLGESPSTMDLTRFANQIGTPYDSPFATQGRVWTPMHIRYLMEVAKFYFLQNPLINAACTKMAVYPITEVMVKDAQRPVREFYETFFKDTLDIHTHLIECGLDYNVYGNALMSVMFPFIKYLICKGCQRRRAVSSSKFEFHGGHFHLHCKSCGTQGEAKVEDVYVRSPHAIRLHRWNPCEFTIYHNEITGEKIYEWEISSGLRHEVLSGKKHVVAKTPQEFINAIRENRPILFNHNRIYHMKRPTVSSKTIGKSWGVPMQMPVLEDVFYLQILRKAQEQIASEHLIPLRVLFPQGTTGQDAPYSMMNLVDWKEQVQQEVAKFRRDRNYIPVLPVPIGNQTISGDGRALLLHQEIRVISEQIISGMGVPIEFVYGGLSYSGSSLSMRMLENVMLNYRQEHHRYLAWLMKTVANYMKWPHSKLLLRDFKMADDLNRRQFLMNLWQAKLLCAQDFLEESGFDAIEQKERRQREEAMTFAEQEREVLAQANAQMKATRIQQLGQWIFRWSCNRNK